MWWLLLACARTCPDGTVATDGCEGAAGDRAVDSAGADSGPGGDDSGTTPADYTVCAGGGAPYADIGAAVAAGETEVRVCAGTYPPVALATAVTLLGVDGAELTVIGDGSAPALTLGDTEVAVEGFTLEPGGAAVEAWRTVGTLSAVRVVQAAGTTLVSQDGGDLGWEGLELRGNTADWLYVTVNPSIVAFTHLRAEGNVVEGLFDLSRSAVDWTNSLVVDNTVTDAPIRVSPSARDSARLVNLAVWDNAGPAGDWWVVDLTGDGANLTVENCAFGGAAGGGARVVDAVFRYNDTWGNPGVNLLADGVTGEGNFEADAELDDAWHPRPESPLVDAGNPDAAYDDVDGTRNDVGGFGGPNGSW